MILAAAVPLVDVVKDWLDYANLVAGFGGFAAAVVAIGLARRAQRTADEAVADERRRTFELEILRDLIEDLDGGLAVQVFDDPRKLTAYEVRLSLLSTELPFWNKVMTLTDVRDVMAAVGLGAEYSAVDDERTRARAEEAALTETVPVLAQVLLFAQTRSSIEDTALAMIGMPGADVSRLHADQRGLRASLEEKTKRLDELSKQIPELTTRRSELRSQGKTALRERLVYDVKQEIWSRVEARPDRGATRPARASGR